ncbi:hypothetical protein FGK63_18520 [Ruegeria sediminis]|uniref:GNAT family N-acetyltransferase n=1 Tax=Ruegeria sediminis TaxID=2583820 RepID=A0ABY2WTX2_9RHOB|nr:hypothetical protein [Ruegeria sediminis]TMV04279.1 hypothetical protein FGK63_18520 [Ruegeria sediminis]
MTEVLWRDAAKDRVITRSDVPSEQTLALLNATVWGSRDTRYRILGVSSKLQRLREPSYFVLSEENEELCVFVLDRCSKPVGSTMCEAYHFAMAATVGHRRNEGLASILIKHIRRYCEATMAKPGFGFGYVEATTEFSLRLSEHVGHGIEADIPLLLFTRLFPREDSHVRMIAEGEVDELLSGLKRLYGDHELVDIDKSLNANECFVYRRDGAVLAGVQAEVLTWSIDALPGMIGAILLGALPRMCGLNRLIDLRNLRILRFGNLLVPIGSETEFFALLSACLARHDAHIGLVMLDRRSPVLARLQSCGRFGLLSKAVKGSVKLCIDTVGLEASLAARLANRPLHVSAADVF